MKWTLSINCFFKLPPDEIGTYVEDLRESTQWVGSEETIKLLGKYWEEQDDIHKWYIAEMLQDIDDMLAVSVYFSLACSALNLSMRLSAVSIIAKNYLLSSSEIEFLKSRLPQNDDKAWCIAYNSWVNAIKQE